MIVWGRRTDIQRMVANVPDNWLMQFHVKHPEHCRKLGPADNATLLYRAEGILKALESNEFYQEAK